MKTDLHTTVPKGTKIVKLYLVDKDGNKTYMGDLKPTSEGHVMFLLKELGTYELVY